MALARVDVSPSKLLSFVEANVAQRIQQGWATMKASVVKEFKLKEEGKVKGNYLTLGEAWEKLQAKGDPKWSCDGSLGLVGGMKWFSMEGDVLGGAKYSPLLRSVLPVLPKCFVTMWKAGYSTCIMFDTPFFFELGFTVLEGEVSMLL
jgi:hypothetical protein